MLRVCERVALGAATGLGATTGGTNGFFFASFSAATASLPFFFVYPTFWGLALLFVNDQNK